MAYLQRNWPRLKASEPLVRVLKATSFVECTTSGARKRAGELYDPSHPLLAKVFAGRPVFPREPWSQSEWLPLLRDVGLQCDVDAAVLPVCARHVASRWSQVRSARKSTATQQPDKSDEETEAAVGSTETVEEQGTAPVVMRAQTEEEEVLAVAGELVRHMLEHLGEMLYTAAFADAVRDVAFVPAVVWGDDAGGGGGGAVRVRHVLTAYSSAVVPADWLLGWTVAPVLDTAAVPPQFAWGSLQLKSPPPITTVAAHLAACGRHDGHLVLPRWPHAPSPLTPEAAYKAVLGYLEGVWGGLGASQRHLFTGVPLVPVNQGGFGLVTADTVYAQLGDAAGLAPFAFQLPAALLPHLDLLSSLGVRPFPSPSDLLTHLTATLSASGCTSTSRTPDVRLSPADVAAVTRALSYLAKHAEEDGAVAAAVAAGTVPVPDATLTLRRARQCVHAHDAAGRLLVAQVRARLTPGCPEKLALSEARRPLRPSSQ